MKEPPMKTPSIVLCQSPLRPSRRADSSRQSAERRRNSDEGGLHPVRPIHPTPHPRKPDQPNKGAAFRVFGVFCGSALKKSHFFQTFSRTGFAGRTGSWTAPRLHVKINQKTMKPFSRAFLSALHRVFAGSSPEMNLVLFVWLLVVVLFLVSFPALRAGERSESARSAGKENFISKFPGAGMHL